MWISKKKWLQLEKKVADLEKAVQNQLSFSPKESEKLLKEMIKHRHEATHGNVLKSS